MTVRTHRPVIEPPRNTYPYIDRTIENRNAYVVDVYPCCGKKKVEGTNKYKVNSDNAGFTILVCVEFPTGSGGMYLKSKEYFINMTESYGEDQICIDWNNIKVLTELFDLSLEEHDQLAKLIKNELLSNMDRCYDQVFKPIGEGGAVIGMSENGENDMDEVSAIRIMSTLASEEFCNKVKEIFAGKIIKADIIRVVPYTDKHGCYQYKIVPAKEHR